MSNLAKRSINYEAQIKGCTAQIGHLQIENQRTNAELEEANSHLEQANSDLAIANTDWIETNQLLQESNRILELGISHIIIDTLNLPTTPRGKLTAAGVRRLMATIGRLATANIIHKRGQYSNWVLRNHMDIDVLRNHIRDHIRR